MQHSTRDTTIGWALVAIQGVFIAAIVLLPRRPAFDGGPAIDGVAAALVVGGGLLGLWSFRHLGRGLTPTPLPNGAVGLVTSGPYRWVRHPIYTAVIAAMGGIALRTRSVGPMLAAGGLAAFLAAKARWEERHLLAGFEGYAAYAAHTPRFLAIRPTGMGPSAGPGADAAG